MHDVEMEWVDAWNQLILLVGDRWEVRCMLPDYSIVSVEDCKGWLQRSAYEGYRVSVSAGFVLGRPGILAHRRRPGEAEAS